MCQFSAFRNYLGIFCVMIIAITLPVTSACPVTVLQSTLNVRGHSLEPISPSLYGRADSGRSWNKSVLRILGGKGVRIPKTCVQAKPKTDPSDGELMGFGFTHSTVLDDKPSTSLASNFIAYYKDKEQGIDDTVMQISQQLAMQLRLRAMSSKRRLMVAMITYYMKQDIARELSSRRVCDTDTIIILMNTPITLSDA
ncbi:hypothetical protein HHX47_DHR9000456 [Lentinula edodes]|nr:hypothetical protein HHX47_DHR9000456 [Lentinula edodes]